MEELFKDFGKVFIRTPLYSYLTLFDDNNETKNLEDIVRLRLADLVFLEALYWSSPQLFEAVLKFKEGSLKGPKEIKLMNTLKKYLIRASTRCTPYGIYAGTSLYNLGLLQDNPNRQMERKVRVDMALMQNIKSRIESDAEIYPHLLYSINNSLYSIPGQYRFLETIIENGKCHYQISSIEHTPFLGKIILLARNRMISPDEIYELTDDGILYEDFNVFIQTLIKTQFLVSELQLGLTTGNELGTFQNVLHRLIGEGIGEARKYLTLFSSIENILIQFRELPLGVLPLDEIKNLKALLEGCGIDVLQEHLFHADLKQSFKEDFAFRKKELEALKKGIFVLGKLTSSTPSQDEKQVEQFKKLFLEKYGTLEIPLVEAMDPEFGIGFPPQENIGNTAFNSLLEMLDLAPEKNEKTRSRNWQFLLQDKIGPFNGKIIKDGIQLYDDDLKDLDDKVAALPNTFSVMGRLLPSGKILLENVGGAHANSLLGRFAYLEEKMGNLCKELADTEKQINPEVIFAEIIFIPEGRLGNIARRPILTEYEIPFLSSSGVAGEKQIPIDDLLVSVQQNEIILRSKKLDQRIIPRLSNAHNFINSQIPIYKFLSSMQFQGIWGFYISWEDFALNKRFLPRISYRNIILHRACWFLQKKDISSIIEANNSLDKLRAFFLTWKVPRFVSLAEGDNELFMDTSNDSYLELLIEEIKSRNSVKLVEWLYDGVVKKYDEDKFSIHQFVMPLAKKNVVNFVPVKKLEKYTVEHSFEPGSEWLYFKIYCGATESDKILLNVIKPAIYSLLKDSVIKKAFFIRYADPHYHIRFRLHLVNSLNKEHLAIALKCVYDLVHPFTANRMIWKVQLDSYQRETERYGEVGILASEDLFFHDSLFYLNCLEYQEFLEDQQVRFLGAIKNLDKWLTLFKMPLEEKLNYCTSVCNAFTNEYGKTIKLQFDMKYRELSGLLPSFLNSDRFEHEFNERDKSLNEILIPKENFGSYIHMSMNRWFFTQQRLMEYMCYLFCRKYYQQTLHHNQGTKIKADLKS